MSSSSISSSLNSPPTHFVQDFQLSELKRIENTSPTQSDNFSVKESTESFLKRIKIPIEIGFPDQLIRCSGKNAALLAAKYNDTISPTICILNNKNKPETLNTLKNILEEDRCKYLHAISFDLSEPLYAGPVGESRVFIFKSALKLIKSGYLYDIDFMTLIKNENEKSNHNFLRIHDVDGRRFYADPYTSQFNGNQLEAVGLDIKSFKPYGPICDFRKHALFFPGGPKDRKLKISDLCYKISDKGFENIKLLYKYTITGAYENIKIEYKEEYKNLDHL